MRNDIALRAALGELVLMKTAGAIDNRTFVNEVDGLIKTAGMKEKAVGAYNSAKDALLLKKYREARAEYKDLENAGWLRKMFDPVPFQKGQAKKKMKEGLRESALAYGGAATGLAGLTGAGIGGKYLYDKYSD